MIKLKHKYFHFKTSNEVFPITSHASRHHLCDFNSVNVRLNDKPIPLMTGVAELLLALHYLGHFYMVMDETEEKANKLCKSI